MDTDNTAKLIVFCNIVLCLPVDITILCTNYKDISYTFCVNFCMLLFFTPLIASCFMVDNIDKNSDDYILNILLVSCYFYSLFNIIFFLIIECFFNIDETHSVSNDETIQNV